MSSDDDPAPPGGGTVTHDKHHQQAASHSPTATAPPTSDAKGPRGNGDAAPPPKLMPIDTPSSAATSDSSRPLLRPTGSSSGGSAFWQSGGMLTSEPSSTESQTANSPAIHTQQQQYPLRPSRWTKARSTSTESSISISGLTTLGSMYNQDGFPNYPVSSDDDHEITRLTMDDAAIAKQVALTDEAVRQINGTQSVVQARSTASMMPAPVSGRTYELPRQMAAYVGPRRTDETRNDLGAGRSFVSSGSSTSSEESEHLASVQWVKQAVQSPSYPPFGPYFHSVPQAGRPSSPKMPPPPTSARHMPSPRRNGSSGLPNTQHSGGPGFAPPPLSAHRTSNSADSGGDNEDDDQTVGIREGSPSSSSASGLDLLSHAAAHHERSHERSHYSTQVKRKAGAEAVAQWRESGIPTGTPRVSDVRAASGGYDSPGYESTLSDGQSRERETLVEPPKKRRRSEMKLEAPDARLRQPAPSDGHESDLDYETDHSDGGSDYRGGGAGGGGTKVRRPSAGSRAKGKKNSTARVRGAGTLPLAAPPPNSAKADGPKKGGGRKVSPTASSAKGSNSSRRLSNTTDDKTGTAGVQCEYVNPLPPYQRCPDVFTRKYDIPRHMARHARREGDLVQEGKLPEEKALLWKTIRDKPRIRCEQCGECFTRQDALKRHQSKQHHH